MSEHDIPLAGSEETIDQLIQLEKNPSQICDGFNIFHLLRFVSLICGKSLNKVFPEVLREYSEYKLKSM